MTIGECSFNDRHGAPFAKADILPLWRTIHEFTSVARKKLVDGRPAPTMTNE
jgi:hypothetical protein